MNTVPTLVPPLRYSGRGLVNVAQLASYIGGVQKGDVQRRPPRALGWHSLVNAD
jgi:hypothetical protein